MPLCNLYNSNIRITKDTGKCIAWFISLEAIGELYPKNWTGS